MSVISHSCDTPTLPLHTSFLVPSICPLPLLSHLTFSLPVSICLSLSLLPLACPRDHLSSQEIQPAQPVCVRVFSGGACSKAGVHRIRRQSARAPSACARTCQCTFSVMVTEDSVKSINKQHTALRSTCSSLRAAKLTPGCRCSRSNTPSILPPSSALQSSRRETH